MKHKSKENNNKLKKSNDCLCMILSFLDDLIILKLQQINTKAYHKLIPSLLSRKLYNLVS